MDRCKPLELGQLTALTMLSLPENRLTSVPGRGLHLSTFQLNLSRF